MAALIVNPLSDADGNIYDMVTSATTVAAFVDRANRETIPEIAQEVF